MHLMKQTCKLVALSLAPKVKELITCRERSNDRYRAILMCLSTSSGLAAASKTLASLVGASTANPWSIASWLLTWTHTGRDKVIGSARMDLLVEPHYQLEIYSLGFSSAPPPLCPILWDCAGYQQWKHCQR